MIRMRIGDKNYLLVEKRGCNFFQNDGSTKNSDVGNYRVFIRFIAKDGTKVCGDVSRFQGSEMLCADMCRYDDNGNCFGLVRHKPGEINYHAPRVYPYTIEGILRYVNDRSAEHYDDIKWVCSFTFEQKKGENFTPSSKIAEWAKREHLRHWYHSGDIRVETYTGVWKYMMYVIRTFQGKTGPFERVTIFLENGDA